MKKTATIYLNYFYTFSSESVYIFSYFNRLKIIILYIQPKVILYIYLEFELYTDVHKGLFSEKKMLF